MQEAANVVEIPQDAIDEAREELAEFLEYMQGLGHSSGTILFVMAEFLSEVVETVETHPVH